MKSFCIIGSINMDLVATVERFPRPGETLTATSFQVIPGGKGANQAVALSRLGAAVSIFGRVGNDSFGKTCLALLEKENVGTAGVLVDAKAPTGTALITVDTAGENHIIVTLGANKEVTPQDIEERFSHLPPADIYLLQLEIPLESVTHILRKKTAGKIYILDPAPAVPLPRGIYPLVDYLTPNLKELEILSGLPAANEKDIYSAAQSLLYAGTPCVIVKAGKQGAYIVREGPVFHVPAFPVKAVDTTGAGDTFNAAFAAALGKGLPLEKSVEFANAAAALSTQKYGAQTAMPREEEVTAFLKETRL
ncbi:MAG: ribokinase [Spirochaetales bacterium]|jgi:ribokinase|nr:ribokinase [Spirochaetales bacterium]